MGNFVILRLFLFLFCISFPWSGSQIEIRTAVLIFEYYKKQYSNADRQKGIRIFVPGLAFDSSFEIFISHVWREVLHAWREGGRKGVVAGD